MQPVQLSLLPDQLPLPPPMLVVTLPEEELSAAVGLLGRLIARAATEGEGVGDE